MKNFLIETFLIVVILNAWNVSLANDIWEYSRLLIGGIALAIIVYIERADERKKYKKLGGNEG